MRELIQLKIGLYQEVYMQFNCAVCHTDKEGKKFVYANSNRTVKVYVCADCHRAKVQEMQEVAAKFGKEMVLGVLKVKEE